jgi:hypothetical protein
MSNEEKDFFSALTLGYAKKHGYEKAITPEGNLSLYHGTSTANADKINKSGKFKGYPFFALDLKTATRFAQQADGTSTVLNLVVDPDAVLPTGGYLSARIEGLTRNSNNVWTVK